MVWHIMVWFTGRDSKSYYDYPFAVHFFSRKLSCETALAKATEILKNVRGNFRFVGYEELPVNVSRDLVVAVEFRPADFGNYDLNVITNTITNDVAEEITKHRLGYLTVDIDEYKPEIMITPHEKLATALDVASENSAEVRVFRTRGGYHVRARLKNSIDFEKLMELRQKAWDDPERVKIDYLYHEHGLTFLTNFLFNEKCVFDARSFTCFEEREVPLEDVTIAREVYNFGADIERLEFAVERGIRAVVGSRVLLYGNPKLVTKELVSKVRKEIERMHDNEETIAALSKAYGDAKTFTLWSVSVVDLGYVVYIVAPKELIGSLIGKGGARVRSVERLLGKRVVVVDRDSRDVAEVYADLVRTAVRRALST
jgi:transcription antitermination factor NusA-like protein